MITADIDKLIVETIPIYTIKNPHPMKGRPDCNLNVFYKKGLREILKNKLTLALETGEDIDLILEEYKNKVAEL